MGGQQIENAARGMAYEAFAGAVLGRIAAMVQVSRPIDYGVDFYCLPLVRTGEGTESGRELCAVQVKGGNDRPITFGGYGIKKDEKVWKSQEIEWLRTLNVPLFLATVDEGFETVRVYSLTPAIACFWKGGTPFKITCDLQNADLESHWTPSEAAKHHRVEGCKDGDGTDWTVDLGPPILKLSMARLSDEDERRKLGEVLLRWIQADRENLDNLASDFAQLRLTDRYRTNEMPTGSPVIWSYFQTAGDASALGALARLSPVVGYLCRVLHHQQNSQELSIWRPILERLEEAGKIDPFGTEVLAALRAHPL